MKILHTDRPTLSLISYNVTLEVNLYDNALHSFTFPKASVAEIDSLFFARPARAEEGTYYSQSVQLHKLMFKCLLSSIELVQFLAKKDEEQNYRPRWPPRSFQECGCTGFERPTPPRRSRSSQLLWC